MNQEKVLARVKKLLALAVDKSNINESENALLMAQKLMAEHNISMSQVDAVDVDRKPEVVERYASYSSRNMPWWYLSLARIIADNFQVAYLVGVKPSKQRHKPGTPQQIIFVGLQEDVELAVEVYQFALDAIKYHADKYARWMYSKGHPMHGLRDAFTEGFLTGLKEKFEKQVAENNWLAVIEKHPAVVDYIDNKVKPKQSQFTAHKNATANELLRATAFAAGVEEGQQFEVRRNALKDHN